MKNTQSSVRTLTRWRLLYTVLVVLGLTCAIDAHQRGRPRPRPSPSTRPAPRPSPVTNLHYRAKVSLGNAIRTSIAAGAITPEMLGRPHSAATSKSPDELYDAYSEVRSETSSARMARIAEFLGLEQKESSSDRMAWTAEFLGLDQEVHVREFIRTPSMRESPEQHLRRLALEELQAYQGDLRIEEIARGSRIFSEARGFPWSYPWLPTLEEIASVSRELNHDPKLVGRDSLSTDGYLASQWTVNAALAFIALREAILPVEVSEYARLVHKYPHPIGLLLFDSLHHGTARLVGFDKDQLIDVRETTLHDPLQSDPLAGFIGTVIVQDFTDYRRLREHALRSAPNALVTVSTGANVRESLNRLEKQPRNVLVVNDLPRSPRQLAMIHGSSALYSAPHALERIEQSREHYMHAWRAELRLDSGREATSSESGVDRSPRVLQLSDKEPPNGIASYVRLVIESADPDVLVLLMGHVSEGSIRFHDGTSLSIAELPTRGQVWPVTCTTNAWPATGDLRVVSGKKINYGQAFDIVDRVLRMVYGSSGTTYREILLEQQRTEPRDRLAPPGDRPAPEFDDSPARHRASEDRPAEAPSSRGGSWITLVDAGITVLGDPFTKAA